MRALPPFAPSAAGNRFGIDTKSVERPQVVSGGQPMKRIMERSGDTICFHCGQAVQDPPRFNLLASGEYCPACRDRVLDSAPSLLPARPGVIRDEPVLEGSEGAPLEPEPSDDGSPEPPPLSA